jgi:hypothetical protein
MPQLDKLSYISSLLWLLPILTILYIFTLKWILPTIAITLKLRNKITKSFALNSITINKEIFSNIENQNKLGENIIEPVKHSIDNLNKKIVVEEKIKTLNVLTGNEFKEINKIIFSKFTSFYLITLLLEKE